MNHSLPIGSINNTSERSVWQEVVDSNLKRTSYRAHDMVYFAYAHRKKRTAGEELQYSADTCRKASSELASLLNGVVAQPGIWARFKNRIQELQNITKSADCKAGR